MRNFLIWFQQRSGSSHLVSLLNSHPEIWCKGEMFGCCPVGGKDDSQQFPGCIVWGDKVYRRVINRFPGQLENPADEQCLTELEQFFSNIENTRAKSIRGFKFKFPSQQALFPEVDRSLRSASLQLRIVVLHRRDYLRRALSVLNLQRLQSSTNQANLREPADLPPTNFDVQEIIRLIRYYEDIESKFCAWSQHFDHVLSVEYEELVSDPGTVSQTIQQFLGVRETMVLKSKTFRISPARMEDLVLNIDELNETLKQNRLKFQL